MERYLLCWGGGAVEDRYLYSPPYPAVYRMVEIFMCSTQLVLQAARLDLVLGLRTR
ncbi:hypothetical protein XENOCAPTIV_022452, partial [Xenoophorus captivus]